MEVAWIAALGALVGAIVGVFIMKTLGASASAADALAEKSADAVAAKLAERFNRIDSANERTERSERELRSEISSAGLNNRQELAQSVAQFGQSLGAQMTQIATVQNNQIDSFAQQLVKLTDANEARLNALQKAVDERLAGFAQDARNGREESANTLKRFGDALNAQLADVRATLDARLKDIETQNGVKLEEMRKTVDEKLHATLEQRLSESFKQVSAQLESVHKGLGEMQNLATGVGDLKRVLTNVKSRGTWGEVQLAALLEQILTPEQYATNIATVPKSSERVEFAVRFPGEGTGEQAWLPIDSKFPIEDYERILAAQEAADMVALEAATKSLESRIKLEARTIRDKYIAPPHTLDFGVLFLPTEGLYAEVLRRPGLTDTLQREFRVVVAGPTTLTAMLTAFRQGFRTLAIQKRSAEVRQILGAVKTEFGKFGDVLARTKRQLEAAANSIDDAEVRTRAMTRELKKVEALPESEAIKLLGNANEAERDGEGG